MAKTFWQFRAALIVGGTIQSGWAATKQFRTSAFPEIDESVAVSFREFYTAQTRVRFVRQPSPGKPGNGGRCSMVGHNPYFLPPPSWREKMGDRVKSENKRTNNP